MRLSIFGLVFLMGAYFFGAIYAIEYPGFHYDELYYVNGALGNLDHTLLFEKVFEIPAFHVFYQGYLKAWIMAPILGIFETTYYSTRMPNIIFTLAFLIVYHTVLLKCWGRVAAFFSVAILVMHPDFFWFTRLDFSPVVIELILQWTSILLFLQGNVFLGLPILVGLFNKLTFLWWSMGFFFNALFFYPVRRRLLLVSLILPLAFLLFRALEMPRGSDFISLIPEFHRLNALFTQGAYLLSGGGFFQKFIREEVISAGLVILWGSVFLTSAICLFREAKHSARRSFGSMLLFAVLFQVIFVAFLKDAQKPWHLVLLLPQFAAIAAYGLSRVGRYGWMGLCLFAALYLPKQIEMINFRDTPKDIRWSPAIIELAEFCRINHPCISVDWGIHNQLLGILRDPRKVVEFNGEFNRGAHFILFPSESGVSTSRKDFFVQAERKGFEFQHISSSAYSQLNSSYKIYKMK